MDAPPPPAPAFRPTSARPDSALTACCSSDRGDGAAHPTSEQIERLDWVCAALGRPSQLVGIAAGAGGLGGPAGAKVALLRVSFESSR
jgi:hypothetical protein